MYPPRGPAAMPIAQRVDGASSELRRLDGAQKTLDRHAEMIALADICLTDSDRTGPALPVS